MLTTQSYRGLLAAALLLATAAGAGAQEFRATIRGQVVDSQQAALPGATVTAQDSQKGLKTAVTTHWDGRFQKARRRPGT